MGGWSAMARRRLRPPGFDDLGLRRALDDGMLPFLVAAMAFLAALALGGSVGAAALARHWQQGAGSALTVQVPKPDPARVERVATLLRGTPGIAEARPLSEAELGNLLRPWLGDAAKQLALPLPAVIEVHLAGAGPDLAAVAARLDAIAPGTIVESHGIWVRRLAALARSLQACAWVALTVVAGVAVAVVAAATRAGLAARREAIDIVHGLGATDGYIAARFAGRATRRAAAGGAVGAVAALPMLLVLAMLAAPFAATPSDPSAAWFVALPPAMWLLLPGLPLAASVIGFVTAQGTVRFWLRQLP
jgi:cell division transport system permease protein